LVVRLSGREGTVVRVGHQYLQRIQVTIQARQPKQFVWRGTSYLVAEILNTWRLSTRWWESAAYSPGASDRHYYRLRCVEGMMCDVYYDGARRGWVLDRMLD
jgi:uncharacterized protein DUF6504